MVDEFNEHNQILQDYNVLPGFNNGDGEDENMSKTNSNHSDGEAFLDT
jgi:hypothetical protein